MQTKLFFTTLITSCYCLAKTILFNCLISSSHYSVQYFLYWRLGSLRSSALYRSVLVMVRHACAEKRQRGRAARHSLRVRCGFFFSSALVMIAEKSHFTTHCRVCKTASVKAHPEHSSEEALALKFNLSGSRTHRQKGRES